MAMGQGESEGWDFLPRPAWFCLTPSPPHPAYGENFLTLSLPLRAPRSPTPPHKTLLLVNLLATISIFFNKFIPSNQTNF